MVLQARPGTRICPHYTVWTSGQDRHQKSSREAKVAICHKTEGAEQTEVAMLVLNISFLIEYPSFQRKN